MKIPVVRHREPKRKTTWNELQATPVCIRALATKTQQDHDTEGDWKTVTTEYVNDYDERLDSNLAQATGFSYADNPKAYEPILHQADHMSAPKMIHHPSQPKSRESYHIRNDKQTNRPLLVPRFKETDACMFPQNSCRPSPSQRTATAFHNIGKQFRKGDRDSREKFAIEMDDSGGNYMNLGSDGSDDHILAVRAGAISMANEEKPKSSCLRYNMGQFDPVPPIPSVYKKQSRSESDTPSGMKFPHQATKSEGIFDVPQLPFPLLSLSEAAVKQYLRRTRGEEDHTDPVGSFISRVGTRTISTVSSSNCPQTPRSTRFRFHAGDSDASFARPVPAYVGDRKSRVSDQPSSKHILVF